VYHFTPNFVRTHPHVRVDAGFMVQRDYDAQLFSAFSNKLVCGTGGVDVRDRNKLMRRLRACAKRGLVSRALADAQCLTLAQFVDAVVPNLRSRDGSWTRKCLDGHFDTAVNNCKAHELPFAGVPIRDLSHSAPAIATSIGLQAWRPLNRTHRSGGANVKRTKASAISLIRERLEQLPVKVAS